VVYTSSSSLLKRALLFARRRGIALQILCLTPKLSSGVFFALFTVSELSQGQDTVALLRSVALAKIKIGPGSKVQGIGFKV
jgi:hypothetical protein